MFQCSTIKLISTIADKPSKKSPERKPGETSKIVSDVKKDDKAGVEAKPEQDQSKNVEPDTISIPQAEATTPQHKKIETKKPEVKDNANKNKSPAKDKAQTSNASIPKAEAVTPVHSSKKSPSKSQASVPPADHATTPPPAAVKQEDTPKADKEVREDDSVSIPAEEGTTPQHKPTTVATKTDKGKKKQPGKTTKLKEPGLQKEKSDVYVHKSRNASNIPIKETNQATKEATVAAKETPASTKPPKEAKSKYQMAADKRRLDKEDESEGFKVIKFGYKSPQSSAVGGKQAPDEAAEEGDEPPQTKKPLIFEALNKVKVEKPVSAFFLKEKYQYL